MSKKSAKKSKKIVPKTNSKKPLADTHVKNKGGRPKEDISDKVDFDQLLMLCEKGFTDKELADFYKVTDRTIRNWKEDKWFISSLKEGKELADRKVEKSLFERACGYEHKDVDIKMYEGNIIKTELTKHYPPDPTSMIFWLKNRKPEQWRDKQEVQHSGEIKTISETTNFFMLY